MSVCALYLCLRCVYPLQVWGWVKLMACALIFLCAYKLQLSRWLFPGFVVPEIPSLWLIVSGWAFAVIVLWTLLSLAFDVYLGLRRVFWRSRTGRGTQRRHGPRVALLLVAALTLATFSTYQGVRVPPVKRVDLYIDNLPVALHGFRIVQLSDMHISPLFRQEWTRAVVKQSNALRPDLIVLTGDMIDGSTRARAADVAPLADLRARYGVYACLGNHEYYAGMRPWVKMFQRLGVPVLVNSHVTLAVHNSAGEGGAAARSATLVVGGVADPTGASLVGGGAPSVKKTFAGSPAPSPVVWRLLLAHQPRLADEASRHGVGLQLSGHTHGGQLFPASLTVGRFNGGYLADVYSVNSMPLYVSRGVGLWGGFPIRLGAPSEITEIILHPRGASTAEKAR